MKLRYIGTSDPTDDEIVTVFGRTFARGKALEVKDEAAAAKLAANPTFEVVGGDKD